MADNWAQEKHRMIPEPKNRLKPIKIQLENHLGLVNSPYLDQLITPKKAKLGPTNNFTAVVLLSGPSLAF